MPQPAPLATPQRPFSEIDHEDPSAATRRRLLVAGVAVALIVSAFLFTLFVVQPFLARRQAPAPQPRTDATVTPISSDQPGAGQVHLSVRTTPPSEVLFDGGSLGQSPVRNATVPTGFHTLTFQRPGLAPITRAVTLKPGDTPDLSFDLN
jgi:hypothetical protein